MKTIVIAIVGAIGLSIVLSIILAFPTMTLWNWLMPEIFKLKEINFDEAVGLILLCQLLFPKITNFKIKRSS